MRTKSARKNEDTKGVRGKMMGGMHMEAHGDRGGRECHLCSPITCMCLIGRYNNDCAMEARSNQ